MKVHKQKKQNYTPKEERKRLRMYRMLKGTQMQVVGTHKKRGTDLGSLQ